MEYVICFQKAAEVEIRLRRRASDAAEKFQPDGYLEILGTRHLQQMKTR